MYSIVRNLSNFVHSSYHENVIAVSIAGQWEQESAKLIFPLNRNKGLEDFNFDGVYWRDLSFQGPKRRWHLQTRIRPHIRDDTNSRNHCPRFMAKPSYRIKPNTTTKIEIPFMDKDGDLVRCSQPIHIAAGEFGNITVPGLSVLEDCSVEIAALSKYGYKDEDWIAVLVTVRDFPRTDVIFGDDVYQTAMFAFSETSLQFAVNVKDVLEVPVFIYPTPPAKHEFYLYIGVSLKILVFAKTSENTTINSFAVTGIDKETYEISPAQSDPDGREHVKFAEFKWTPSDSDIGFHLACITATDLTGVDSEERRCFVLNVKGERFNQSTHSSNKPYFVHVPSTSEFVKCPTDTTCVIPIYVNSSSIVSQMHVRDAYVRTASIGLVSQVTFNGEVLYKADLSFQHPKNDEVQICLQAEDINNLSSDELCFTTKIIPPDPCLETPCLNSGICKSDKEAGTFNCQCVYGYEGINCQLGIDDCPMDNPCNGHGLCIDGVKSYTCKCFSRYDGDRCEHDTCSTSPQVDRDCANAAPACSPTCGSHGVCVNSHCQCSLGFTGPVCTSRSGILSNASSIKFIDPTLKNGGKLVCYLNMKEIQNCELPVFIQTKTGHQPTLTVSSSHALSRTTFSPVQNTQTIAGFDNVFASLISVKGALNMNERSEQYVCVDANIGPVKRYCNTSLTEQPGTHVITNVAETPDLKLLYSTFVGSSGTDVCCYQTTVDGSEHGMNVDEFCFEVDISLITGGNIPVNTSSQVTRFISPAKNSLYICKENSDCYITVITEKTQLCDQVIHCCNKGDDIHIFVTNELNDVCVTELVVHTLNEGQEQTICAMAGISGPEITFTVLALTPDGFGPCQKRHCENGGTCVSENGNAFCYCAPGYTGETCETGFQHFKCFTKYTGECELGFQHFKCFTMYTGEYELGVLHYVRKVSSTSSVSQCTRENMN
ncbi:uncharacterized protein LOC128207891 [Mya arenaria]|uniref:uncharacterized protein LOC128207891 n=1 Tax=Mya arenaria TaxID=6604 RepID=UPI0022E013CB|nr:uncharacterized protein LOC128207891 [Mya arenaria]